MRFEVVTKCSPAEMFRVWVITCFKLFLPLVNLFRRDDSQSIPIFSETQRIHSRIFERNSGTPRTPGIVREKSDPASAPSVSLMWPPAVVTNIVE